MILLVAQNITSIDRMIKFVVSWKGCGTVLAFTQRVEEMHKKLCSECLFSGPTLDLLNKKQEGRTFDPEVWCLGPSPPIRHGRDVNVKIAVF
jgi:hypothetical protein